MKNLLLLVVTASVLLVACGDSTEPIFTTTPIGTAVTTSTPTPTPSLTPSLTPSQTPTPSSTPLVLEVRIDIKYRGGAGIYKGAVAREEYYIGRVPRGISAEVIGRAEYPKELGVGTPQPIKTRWLKVRLGEITGFSVYELFEQTLTEEEYLALPIIDIDWESGTGLPVPTPIPSPTPTPTPTLIPTPTPPPTRQRTEKTELQFKEDDQAVIHVYYDDCTGVTESFRNGDVVTVFGRSKDKEDELYVGKKVIIVITGIETYKYVYGFVRTSCLEWSGNIEDWADVIFPTPIPTPSPLPTPTPISTGTTRR